MDGCRQLSVQTFNGCVLSELQANSDHTLCVFRLLHKVKRRITFVINTECVLVVIMDIHQQRLQMQQHYIYI